MGSVFARFAASPSRRPCSLRVASSVAGSTLEPTNLHTTSLPAALVAGPGLPLVAARSFQMGVLATPLHLKAVFN